MQRTRRLVPLVLSTAFLLTGGQIALAENASQDPNLDVQPLKAPTGIQDAAKTGPEKGDGPPGGDLDIRIDLSNSVSTTPGNWNNIANIAGNTADLIDFVSGLGTGVSIDGTGSPWSLFVGDDGGTFPDQDWLIQPATQDGAGLTTDATGTFQITGLPDGSYQVEVVSARTTFGYLNTFTANGANADRTFLGSPVVTPWNSTDDGLTPGNWLIWDAVTPVAGVITLTDTAGPGTLGIVNAIRVSTAGPVIPDTPIIEVPTMSTWGFLALGLVLCLAAAMVLRRGNA